MQQNTSGSRLDGVIALEERFTYRFAVIASRMGSALAPSHERYGLSVAAWRVLAVIGRYEHNASAPRPTSTYIFTACCWMGCTGVVRMACRSSSKWVFPPTTTCMRCYRPSSPGS
jgi:hypothetical protein